MEPAYRWSTQTGLYIDSSHQRRGGGRTLYTQLLNRLGERGYRRAFAGITQPNEASNAFHRSMGFRDAGLYRRVEWKLGRWHDVAWMQCDLPSTGDAADPPGLIT
jgi:L-amino acid N-acyltransferase YncA